MKSKLRNAIIIAILCLMALCSVIALVAVFAANKQTLSSGISVSYKASEIEGKVSANYYVGAQDKTGTPMTTTGTASGAKELIFKASEGSANGALNPQGDIELTLENNYVVFEYIFQNGLGDPVSTDFMARLTFATTSAENVKITTKESNEKLVDFFRIVAEVETPGSEENQGWLVLDHNEEDNYITTKYFYVKVEVENTSLDASFSGGFNWDLSVVEPTLDSLSFTLVSNDHYAVALANPAPSTPADIIIPKTYTGDDGVERPVTEIAVSGFENYKSNGHIIYIPDSITYIRDKAFYNCDAIKGEIIVSEYVTSVGLSAFFGCPIQSVIIGKNVVGFGALRDGNKSSNLKYLTIEGDKRFVLNMLTFAGCYIENLIIGDNVTDINSEDLYNIFPSHQNHLKNILVGTANETYTSRDKLGKECNVLIEKSSKTIIRGGANAIIPEDDSVTTIEAKAFQGCNGLTSIKIPANISSIEMNAFNGVNLYEVAIDSQIICENLISGENSSSTKSYLIDSATVIKAKYEIAGIDGYTTRKFTRSESQDSAGYWTYT